MPQSRSMYMYSRSFQGHAERFQPSSVVHQHNLDYRGFISPFRLAHHLAFAITPSLKHLPTVSRATYAGLVSQVRDCRLFASPFYVSISMFHGVSEPPCSTEVETGSTSIQNFQHHRCTANIPVSISMAYSGQIPATRIIITPRVSPHEHTE